MAEKRFSLLSNQVPDPPDSNLWVDILRWMICVMDPDDSALTFVAGNLSYCLKNEGLTENQAKVANKLYRRVYAQWEEGILECQLWPDSEEVDRMYLESLKTMGEA